MSDPISTQVADESPYVAAPTRPGAASRKARRPRAPRKVTRFTLDLEHQQHLALRTFALVNGIEAAPVLRTLIYLLESDPTLADRVLDELFAEDEVESNFTPDGV